MAGAVLAVAGAAWLLVGLAGAAMGLLASEAMLELLPPVTVDADGLARTIVALGVGAVLVGLIHLGVAHGIARGRRWATSAGILVGAWSAFGFVALGAAAFTSAAAGSLHDAMAVVVGIGCLVAAFVYGRTAVTLVHRLRIERPS